MDEEPLFDEYDAAADGIPSAAVEGPLSDEFKHLYFGWINHFRLSFTY